MTNPIITVCLGTLNRLEKLQRMVQSVRDTVPDLIAYRFVISDNGSTDGTPEWIDAQPDCELVQLGEPVGAVRAFTEAAKRSTSRYTLLINDDNWFAPDAILRALAYIEQTPECGATVFSCNTYTGSDTEFRCDVQKVLDADGKEYPSPYSGNLLLRTWLGHEAGWWGSDGPLKDAWTYAGDNHLCLQIHMRGYRVEAVKGCNVWHERFEDESRRIGQRHHNKDVEAFLTYYNANPPRFGVIPVNPPDEGEHLRVLYIYQAAGDEMPWHREQKQEFAPGLQEAGLVVRYNYRAFPEHAAADLARLATTWQPHLIWSCIHDQNGITARQMHAIRSRTPRAVTVNCIGDVWERLYLSEDGMEMMREFDILCCTNADVVPPLRERGVQAFHLPTALEIVENAEMPAHDVVWQGNGRPGQRKQIGALMQEIRAEGVNVGFYAATGYPHEWITGNTWYNFEKIQGVNANALIAISDNEFDAAGYTSDRFWQIIASGGALALHQQTPRFEELTGMKDGVHYVAWTDLADLRAKITFWLMPEQQKRRKQIVRNALRNADRHTFAARVRTVLTEYLPHVVQQVGELETA